MLKTLAVLPKSSAVDAVGLDTLSEDQMENKAVCNRPVHLETVGKSLTTAVSIEQEVW